MSRAGGLALALCAASACGEHTKDDFVELEPFELRSGEPRAIRWQLCKEGKGTPELVNAQLDVPLEPPNRLEVRAWATRAAFEANEEPEPFPGDVLADRADQLRLELRPQAAFESDGRRCTGDRFLRLDLVAGTRMTVEATFEAHVIDFDDVVDRLILEAELLPAS